MAVAQPDIEAIFYAARQKSAHERAGYLDQACGDDPAVRHRVEQFLAAQAEIGGFLESRAPELDGTLELSPVTECPGTVIGPYKLLEQIGEGGFGVVFMAEQQRPVQRRVALKVLKPGMDTGQVVARFEAERQALALMDHPNIAKVHDGGSTDTGRPYFVMELVRGVPITEFCDRNHLPVRQRLELFISVCQAVQHAHQKGVIHRDLKPSNVLVTLHDGVPVAKVIDFGVAKAILGQQLTERTLFTNFAQMVGTPLYMSPEQAEMSGLDVDTRTDIYALGVLLYELLTGTTPLDRERLKTAGYDEIRRIIREQEPARPSARVSTLGAAAATISASRQTDPPGLRRLFRGELDWIVMECLEKDRNRRYETAASLVADVQRYLKDEPVQACPPSAGYRLRKFAQRNRGPVAAGLALAALLVLGTVGTSIGLAWALQAERTATKATDDLKQNVENERIDAYFRRISLAYRELSADNLGGALTLLNQCPEDLREWEWHFLMRLCRVEPVILPDNNEVNSIAFSPDGEYIAAACGDGAVKVWNIRTRKVVQELPNAHPEAVFSVAFHPHGKHLATVGADQRVKVWDLATKKEVFNKTCYVVHNNGTAYTVAFSPGDGRELAAGSDGAVNVWDWTSRDDKPVHTFLGHKKPRAISVAFSRDGQILASGSGPGSLKLWDLEARGKPLPPFPIIPGVGAAALAFSPDGGRLATASFGRRVDVWDTTTGRHLRELPHPGAMMLGVAFSVDGRRLASVGEDKVVHLWDPTTGREVLGLRGHTVMCGCVAFSPDGWRLASASKDGTIRVWDATPLRGDEGQEIRSVTPHGDEVWSIAVSPDGQKFVSAGWGGMLKVWDARTREVSVPFSGHAGIVFCVAWQPDGQRIASAGLDGDQLTVMVWDAQTGRQDFELTRGSEEYLAVAFSPDRRYLVTGNAHGKVQVWDARNGDPVGTLGTHERKTRVRGVAFSHDGLHLASAGTGGDGKVYLWDATRLEEKQKARHILDAQNRGNGLTVAFSPDGRRLVTGGEKHTAKIWDVETGQELKTLEGHSGDVCAVAFSPDPGGRWVASAGEDSTVKVWDSHSGKLLRNFRGHTGLVGTLAFLDGHTLISGSRDRTIKFWDLTPLEEAPDR